MLHFRQCLLTALTCALTLLCGCASSERMNRLSGGVVAEYSAPQSYRIRSEKYLKKSRKLTTPTHANQQQLGGIDESLVNLWPFMFKTNHYLSVLWPFMDFDDYGMAIRPFYNHEGDDYSILFPLSSWNTHNHEGWFLNAYWDKDAFGLFPLGYQKNTPEEFYCNYLLFGHRHSKKNYRDYARSAYEHPGHSRSISHTWILPFYTSYEERLDLGKWSQVNWYHQESALAMLKYMLGDKAPKNRTELLAFHRELCQTLPLCEGGYTGFFPFSHYYTTGLPRKGYRWRGLAGLIGMSSSDKHLSWDVLGPVLSSYNHQYIPSLMEKPDGTDSVRFSSWLLLSYYRQYRHVASRPDIDALRELHHTVYEAENNWDRTLPKLKELLKRLPGTPELPANVNRYTLRAYLKNLTPLPEADLKTSTSVGCLPIFNYRRDDGYLRWSVPILGTRYSRHGTPDDPQAQSKFFSLPLLTYTHANPQDDKTAILPPLIWYSHTTKKDRTTCKIHDRSAVRPDSDDQAATMTDDYAALGLYYRGHYTFYVVKEGLSATAAEKLRSGMKDYQRNRSWLAQSKANLAKERKRCEQWKTRTKIQYYQKKIREEELKLKQQKWDRDWAKNDVEAENLRQLAAELGFDFHPERLTTEQAVKQERERLFQCCTEPRLVSDIGSGLFYHKELFHDGDYHWNFLGFLAGGSKDKERESTQILHFLYRHRKEGTREETVFFPFVSIQKDGDDSKFSFLWRVFQHKVTKGKASGYVLFIPY